MGGRPVRVDSAIVRTDVADMDMARSCVVRSRRGPPMRGIVRVESEDRRVGGAPSFGIGEAQNVDERAEVGAVSLGMDENAEDGVE
jgi:hypothetical protein